MESHNNDCVEVILVMTSRHMDQLLCTIYARQVTGLTVHQQHNSSPVSQYDIPAQCGRYYVL